MSSSEEGIYVCIQADSTKQFPAAVTSTQQVLMMFKLKGVEPKVLLVLEDDKSILKEISPSGTLPVLFRNVKGSREVYEEVGAIEDFIESLPGPSLKGGKGSLMAKIQNLMLLTKFRSFLNSNNTKAEDTLKLHLEILDKLLASRKTRFVESDSLTFVDSYLLPILLVIRVAGAKKGFQIPATLKNVRLYIEEGDKSQVFQETRPTDSSIIDHWCRR
ncbi:predicted protein [Nematostella vectensis]|uniref:GST N-terminal domain-containing protein n=1 Tax=Nematostella vectensis TaxID=45351 RepID=A7SC76_NEMVE|nr:chloride intracellular channel exl-1 [Nematostella vectensis]XP_048577250.1 chloride intracellular channel exl-1-like [Nematostella vectensis]EDO38693.1 predicted protein [Nematostella vectensis]|eukprot:XP_001630756.1 predicted protein [Nematostella vectensis]